MLNHKIIGSSEKSLVFIHGNSQSLEVWDQVTASPGLSSQFTLIQVDLPGHGKSFRSDKPDEDYALQGLAGHLSDFIKSCVHGEFVLVAHSVGSNIMAEMLPFPKNCRGIFLVGSTIIRKGLAVADIFQPNPNVAAAFNPSPTEAEVNSFVNDLGLKLSEENKTKLKSLFYETDPSLRTYLGASIARQDWIDEIDNIMQLNVPIAVLYGKEDALVRTGYLQDLVLNKWHDRIILIENAGHTVQLERPDELAGFIAEFAKDCFH